MKKKFTFTLAFALISLIGFSQTVTDVQPCPTGFGRNNGNGTCGQQAQIKMFYLGCPVLPPYIDSIYAQGKKLNVVASAPDMSKCSKGYVSYCLSSDIPPVSSIVVYFSTGTTSDAIKTACTIPSGPEAGPTPVVLSSFNAQRDGSSVNLSWKTEQELNSSGYEIQRSSDNMNFETIGTVPSKSPNSSNTRYYSFTDNSNYFGGMSYYRLKMVDLDNTFTYSSVRTIKGDNLKSEIVLFPNPASANQKITIKNISEPSKIMVFDNTGRMIQQISTLNNTGEINNLQRGNYFVKIQGEQSGNSTVKKLTVIN